MYYGSNKDTFSHELGHHIYDKLTPEEKNKWRYIHESSEGKVSAYAGTSPGEDFAETHKYYKGTHTQKTQVMLKRKLFFDKLLKKGK